MKNMTLLSIVSAGILFGVLPMAKASPPALKAGIGSPLATSTDTYRIGDEWGKKPVSMADLANATPSFRRAALATAHVGGATGFYLGKFQGQHVMATNHHVLPSDYCSNTTAQFPLLGIDAPCATYLGTWPEVDLSLFTITVDPQDEAKLLAAAGNFTFHRDVQAGEKLLTIGFGIAGNPSRELMANQDSDCYVFSGNGDYHLMSDPDELNPGDYQAWSFALGCDVSHGDSGSAIVDRDTSEVIGIIWTGRIPKSPIVQSSQNLTRLFSERSAAIWQELSYAVPAHKMGEVLAQVAVAPGTPEETKAILSEMLK